MSVIAIVVTYFPETERLAQLLCVMEKQVERIIVVDNGSCENNLGSLLFNLNVHTKLVNLKANRGLAYALNVGLREAFKHKESYILLLDQDSMPACNMVELLVDHSDRLEKAGIKVAAVGPNYTDSSIDESPFFRLEGVRLRGVKPDGAPVTAVDHLITSGSLVKKEVLRGIGLMEDSLFIDCVDTEWCLRAKARGYQLYGVWSAKMNHRLGLRAETVFGKSVPLHTPQRYYYMFRNGLWLCGRPWVDWKWKVMELRRLLLMFITFSLLAGGRVKNTKYILLAFWHCIQGRMGKFESEV